MATVKLKSVIKKMELTNLTPELDISKIRIHQPDINRPALQLAGYFEHFEATRLQVIGFVEYTYMESIPDADKERVYREFLSFDIPCVVFCRNLIPDPTFVRIAIEEQVPIMVTKKSTSSFMAEIIRWLNVELAPCISIHGVLVDVYGVGVLITGESGIGKSEAALELIKRGHRLVSDDVVEIICSMTQGYWCNVPNFILVWGYDDEYIYAFDAATEKRNKQRVDRFKAESRMYFCFYPDKEGGYKS